MKQDLAIYLGKAIFSLTRLLKIGGGSAAPGLYALKVDPNLVEKLVSKIPKNIIITGTNGKTTTARMLAHFAKTSNFRVIRNHTGSNLERGIASALIHQSSIINRKSVDLGIWELDEAAFNILAPKIRPNIIVFLNVFRDQLDRYGEVDTVVKKWGETLSKLNPQTKILVNGDDANTLKIGESFKNVQRFGVENYKISGESKTKQKYSKKLDFEAKNVKLAGLSGSTFQILGLKIKLPIPGVYHIYDFLAAFAISQNLGLDQKKMISALSSFSPAFGRVEKLPFGYILLIKNPVGATQVLKTIAPQFKKGDRLLLALNDNLADGTDVSWIWDADFESLQSTAGNLQIICSGTRAYDLAVRLKYAGIDPELITIVEDPKIAFKRARTGLSGQLFILPTYTALLHLQSVLAKMGIIKRYWEKS